MCGLRSKECRGHLIDPESRSATHNSNNCCSNWFVSFFGTRPHKQLVSCERNRFSCGTGCRRSIGLIPGSHHRRLHSSGFHKKWKWLAVCDCAANFWGTWTINTIRVAQILYDLMGCKKSFMAGKERVWRSGPELRADNGRAAMIRLNMKRRKFSQSIIGQTCERL